MRTVMRATLLAVGATLAGFASSWTSAAEISGEVAQVRGEAITVAIDGSVKPSKGDEVQIIVDVPGVGEAEVGTATVTAVVDELVLAKIQSASGKIQAGQKVRISAGTTSDQKAESDLERLQGRWRNERSLLDGKPSEAFVGVEAILDGHNLTWAFTNRFSERHAQEGTFELDPTQTLKHFDLTYRTGTMPDQRIYALEGDTLRMGMAGKPRTRPNSFEGAKFQFELKRLPSADPATPPDASPEEIQQFQENLNAAENGDAQASIPPRENVLSRCWRRQGCVGSRALVSAGRRSRRRWCHVGVGLHVPLWPWSPPGRDGIHETSASGGGEGKPNGRRGGDPLVSEGGRGGIRSRPVELWQSV